MRTDPLAYLGEQLNEFRANGTYQRLRELQGPCEPVSIYDGKEVINLASNNYLGLANHPKLKEAAIEAQQFERAAKLRDREKELLEQRSSKEQEWRAAQS